jgi:KipI family sensor histidine kinase inhibitor
VSGDSFPRILDAGDSGLMVLFGDSLEQSVNNAAQAFDAALRDANWPEVVEITPGIRGLLLRYDPLEISSDDMHSRVKARLEERDWTRAEPFAGRRLWRLPVHYGEESGPDIGNVAKLMDCDIDAVIREHSASRLRVLMLGFAPGCAYLGPLPEKWDLPRLGYVKPEVPPGSLSVAVRQTVLFATTIPTGWQTIGRTPFLSFSRHQAPWFHLAPGDEITFETVDRTRFDELAGAVEAGEAIVVPEDLA